MIKKIIVIASIIGLIAFGIPMTDNNRVLASETESGSILTDLVDIDTIEEWRTYADQHGIERDTTYDDCEAVDFKIIVDNVSNTIDVDTVYLFGSRSVTTSGSAVHEKYSNNGSLLFTLKIEGTFSRTPGTSCTCTSASGSFTHPITSLWRCTPSYTRGRKSNTKAYAKMNGTATKVIGAGSITFQYFLYCTSGGTLSSEYKET